MAWRDPPPSSRLTERHLCLTGNGIRLRCKPVFGSCQRQCPGRSGLSAVGQFRHRGRLPDPPTVNTIILRAHGSKFSERCRSFAQARKRRTPLTFDLVQQATCTWTTAVPCRRCGTLRMDYGCFLPPPRKAQIDIPAVFAAPSSGVWPNRDLCA